MTPTNTLQGAELDYWVAEIAAMRAFVASRFGDFVGGEE